MQKSYKTVPLSQIKPYPNNPRINDAAAKDVAKSIEQCGYIAPIVVDENMVILAGHTRLKGLQILGRESADVVICSGLTDEQKRKYRLLDNKITGDFDLDLLKLELDGLDFGDLELDWGIDLDDEPETYTGSNKEINTEDYADEQFECECPRCGFRFNKA